MDQEYDLAILDSAWTTLSRENVLLVGQALRMIGCGYQVRPKNSDQQEIRVTSVPTTRPPEEAA